MTDDMKEALRKIVELESQDDDEWLTGMVCWQRGLLSEVFQVENSAKWHENVDSARNITTRMDRIYRTLAGAMISGRLNCVDGEFTVNDENLK